MTSRTLHTVAVTGALALLLTACTPDSPNPSPSPSPTTTQPSTSASPSPTSTLTPAEQEAFGQVTDVVMSYEQTITDLYSGTRTRVNDLDLYATGDLLERTLAMSRRVSRRATERSPKGSNRLSSPPSRSRSDSRRSRQRLLCGPASTARLGATWAPTESELPAGASNSTTPWLRRRTCRNQAGPSQTSRVSLTRRTVDADPIARGHLLGRPMRGPDVPPGGGG